MVLDELIETQNVQSTMVLDGLIETQNVQSTMVLDGLIETQNEGIIESVLDIHSAEVATTISGYIAKKTNQAIKVRGM